MNTKTLSALAEPSRLPIVELLRDAPLIAGEKFNNLDRYLQELPQNKISHEK